MQYHHRALYFFIMKNKLFEIQKIIERDLVLGSSNRRDDVNRTRGWSETAVESTRLLGDYEKVNSGFKLQFFRLRPSPPNTLLPYVEDGAKGLFARAGNCQECVGLAIYWIFKKNLPIETISVIELPDCFDHVLLKIKDTSENTYFFDPWAKCILEDSAEVNLNPIFNDCVAALILDKETASDQMEITELDTLILNCNTMISNNNVPIEADFYFFKKDSVEFITQFETLYRNLLLETYPKNPSP